MVFPLKLPFSHSFPMVTPQFHDDFMTIGLPAFQLRFPRLGGDPPANSAGWLGCHHQGAGGLRWLKNPGNNEEGMDQNQGKIWRFSWENHRKTIGKPQENHRKMEVYPLVNVYIANWKDPPFIMGKSIISMVIFNSFLDVYQRVSTTNGESIR